MKTIQLLIAALTLSGTAVKAQNKTEGTITYNMTMNLHESLTKEQEIYKSLIPKTLETTATVTFSATKYLAETKKPESNGSVSVSMPGGGGTQIVDNAKQVHYSILKKGKNTYYTEEKNGSAKAIADKKTTRMIAGYKCYKAVYKNDQKETVELWVTDELKVSCNPFEPGIVNGAVLEVNSKKVSYKAAKIEWKAQDAKKFEVQTSWKKITKEQAEDLEEEN